ncbi:hypothetical protein GTY96_25770 [Corallococcus sp. c25j21]|nr:hypothetical protein [Corallococcus silvisoli]
MKQPAVAGTTLQQRVLFDALDLWSDFEQCTDEYSQGRNDTVSLRDESTGTDLATLTPWDKGRSWTSWFTPGASGVRAALNNTGYKFCTIVAEYCSCGGVGTKTQKGAVISGYEYRRVQTGASPFWTPLRFPGQYHDVETDLFENWNRYYDPSIGRYLQPEPMMAVDARSGSWAAYSYAGNNPVRNSDPTGLFIRPEGECKNWSEALARAKVKAGCQKESGGVSSQQSCTKCALPCDICPWLDESTPPTARIFDMTGGIRGGLNPDRTQLGLARWLCGNTTVPGYSFDNTEELAQMLIHEAIHMCQTIGITAPSAKDGWGTPFGKWSPGWDDTEDTVEKCWKESSWHSTGNGCGGRRP